MFKYLMTALIAVTLSACSFDKSGDKVTAQRDKENNLTVQEFKQVEGIYAGIMKLNGNDSIVNLSLGTKPGESSEKDEKGQPITKVIPQGTLFRINPSSTNIEFDAYLNLKQGRLDLINVEAKKQGGAAGASGATASSLGPNDVYSIEFAQNGFDLQNKRLIGVIKNNSASKIGEINLELTNREQSGTGDSEQERYDNLAKEYRAVAGDYVGASVREGKSTDYILTVRVRIKQVGDFKVPEFYGSFQRADDTNGVAAVTLNFGYSKTGTNPPRLYMTGKARYYPNSDYYATLDGYVQNNSYIGSWVTNAGYQGDLNLKRIRTAEESPAIDECLPSKSAEYVKLPKDVPIPIPRPKCF